MDKSYLQRGNRPRCSTVYDAPQDRTILFLSAISLLVPLSPTFVFSFLTTRWPFFLRHRPATSPPSLHSCCSLTPWLFTSSPWPSPSTQTRRHQVSLLILERWRGLFPRLKGKMEGERLVFCFCFPVVVPYFHRKPL